ncbi:MULTISPECIES: CsbD family protein [unclassified Streptomyces]|uniref:CsbD family protein n=1 Tax=unclassified Streptomyces TaxID=2593676 RepID=UPI00224FE10D|nr:MULTISPECIES: CsbD family protein [unclassified Streptomyces]MCX4524161.1 CsbD family protein [Streptomyces sp. NBC_01551]MCX4545320.1 CsbD family protein [Streptomyces sp. NBC_01565]
MADKGKMDQAKGKAKEAAGKVTGNDRMKAEGKMDQAKGKAKEALSETEKRARGAQDSLRDKQGRI